MLVNIGDYVAWGKMCNYVLDTVLPLMTGNELFKYTSPSYPSISQRASSNPPLLYRGLRPNKLCKL